MIFLASQYIIEYDDDGTEAHPAPASISDLSFFKISGIAYVFGNAVLTFNCHHSIPGLVSPVQPQIQLRTVFRSVLTFCCSGLAALCILAMLAFHNARDASCVDHDGPPCAINKLYNLNFSSYHIQFLAKILAAYPLLMIALYPLLTITLRNNLQVLLSGFGTGLNPTTRTRILTLAAGLPMLLLAYAEPDIEKVTSITGAYFGCGIMYIIPSCLVVAARRQLHAEFPGAIPNPNASEFGGQFYLVVLAWGLICIGFSTVNFTCEAIPGCSLSPSGLSPASNSSVP